MVQRYTHNNLTWINLESPTPEELHQIMSEWDIHPLVARELLSTSLRPKVEMHPNFIYLILKFPLIKRIHSKHLIDQQEIDFVIGKNFIITTRYDSIDPLHEFSKIFEVNSILDRNDMGDHTGFVFFYMIRALYDGLLHELEFANDTLRDIEERIFNGDERAMVVKISEISRELLDVRRATLLHREILESFDVAARKFFGEEFSYHTRAIVGEYYKVNNHIESSRELISELRETNNSLLNAKETETIKTLTLVAFLTLPTSVITNLFQMTTLHTPIVGSGSDWTVIVGITFAVTLFFFALAKIKKWF